MRSLLACVPLLAACSSAAPREFEDLRVRVAYATAIVEALDSDGAVTKRASGVFVTPNEVVTLANLLTDAHAIRVRQLLWTLGDAPEPGERLHDNHAEIVRVDATSGLALLRLPARQLGPAASPAPVASRGPEPAEPVFLFRRHAACDARHEVIAVMALGSDIVGLRAVQEQGGSGVYVLRDGKYELASILRPPAERDACPFIPSGAIARFLRRE